MTGTEQPNSVLIVFTRDLDAMFLETGGQVSTFLRAMANGLGYFVAQRRDADGSVSTTLHIPFRNVRHTNQLPGTKGEWTLAEIVVPTGSLSNYS